MEEQAVSCAKSGLWDGSCHIGDGRPGWLLQRETEVWEVALLFYNLYGTHCGWVQHTAATHPDAAVIW